MIQGYARVAAIVVLCLMSIGGALAVNGSVNITTTPGSADVVLNSTNNTYVGTTDGSGMLLIPDVEPDLYDLLVTLEDYEDHAEAVSVSDGENVTLTVTLTPLNATLNLTSVPDGADILVDGASQGVTPKVLSLEPGTYTVNVSKTGFVSNQTDVTLGVNEMLDLTLTLEEIPVPIQNGSVNITTTPGLTDVTLNNSNSTYVGITDSAGNLLFTDVIPGTYSLTVERTNYSTSVTGVTVSEGENVTVAVTITPLNATLNLTSVPSGADVMVDGVSQGVTPEVLSLEAGTYTINLSLTGYYPNSTIITLGINEQLDLMLTLEKLPLANGSVNVNTVPNANVKLNNSNNTYEGVTDSLGSVTLTDIIPGDYALYVTHVNYSNYSDSVTVSEGEEVSINVSLTPLNATLNITSAPNNSSMLIDGTPAGTTPAQFSLAPGNYTINISKDGFISKEIEVTLSPNEHLDLAVALSTIPQEITGNTTNVSGNLLETGSALFSLSLAVAGDVKWTIDGVDSNTTINLTDHTFEWTPGILYTSDIDIATIVAETEAGNVTWEVTVENVINPFFSSLALAPDVFGSDVSVVHVFTNNKVMNFTEMNVTIVGPSATSYQLAINSFNGTETDWQRKITFIPGTHIISEIRAYDNVTGISRTYELPTTGPDIRAHFTATPSSDGGRTVSGGGGGGGGGGLFLTGPELVFVSFNKDVLEKDETQKITLDAKNFNSGVKRVEASLLSPDGTIRKEKLELASGDESYGTWSASFSGFSGGVYELQSVSMWDKNSQRVKVSVKDRSFYVLGDEESGELSLIYTILDTDKTQKGSQVTITLDARDDQGVTSASANVETSRGTSFSVPLELVRGSEQYGTWEGQIPVEEPDTTYAVVSVILTTAEVSEEFSVEARKFYVDPVPESETNFITGGVVQSKFSKENLQKLFKNPLVPTAIGFSLMLLIMVAVFLHLRIKNRMKMGR